MDALVQTSFMVGTNANGITDGPIGQVSFFATPSRNQDVFKEQKLERSLTCPLRAISK